MKLTNQILAVVLATVPVAMSAAPNNQAPDLTKTEKQVRHELVALPFLSIYDNLSFQVEGGKVILTGHVIRPTLKSGAEQVVRRLEGVTSVENQIEVLPLSPFDDALRLRLAQAIYGYGPLNRYSLGAQPPIRIIVKNGNVTLEGVVGNAMDRQLAFMRANGVSGVFSVTNSLGVSAS
ncbi:MAG: BON domain-containing protein [Acidobacteria bacterium]|nr:BON domain-containing protein [Acidobacteriota bacterium]